VQVLHVIHDIFRCSAYSCRRKPEFQSSQIGHCRHTGKLMTTDLTVGPMPNRVSADQVVIFAETEPSFHLPSVKSGFNGFTRRPVHDRYVMKIVCRKQIFNSFQRAIHVRGDNIRRHDVTDKYN
jgi:hypothetical protein